MNKIEPVLVQYFNEHWYKVTVNGVVDYYPSVTTKGGAVAKPFLAKWRGDIGNREADLRLWESQEKGKRTHNALWAMCNDGVVIYQPWDAPNHTKDQEDELRTEYGQRFVILRNQDEMLDIWKNKQWISIVNPKIMHTELIVCDHEHRDAGTIDRVDFIQGGTYNVNGSKPVKLKEGIWITDYKTGGTVDIDDASLQFAPYVVMFEKTYNVKCAGALAIHTGASTKSGIPGLATLVRTREELEEDYADYRHVAALWERKNKGAMPRLFDFPSLIKLKQQEK